MEIIGGSLNIGLCCSLKKLRFVLFSSFTRVDYFLEKLYIFRNWSEAFRNTIMLRLLISIFETKTIKNHNCQFT